MPLAARGVVFEQSRAVGRAHPNRADIACFAGFVGVRPEIAAQLQSGEIAALGALPADVQQQLSTSGWWSGPYARPEARVLLDVPVTLTSWDQFDALFAWNARPVAGSEEQMATWLGAAVRSFFAEGGRQCVVVRTGDPWKYGEWFADDAAEVFRARLARLIPGYPFSLDTSPADPSTWHGIGHLAGLPEVSFVSLPDLAELCAAALDVPSPVAETVAIPENWVECSDPLATLENHTMYAHPAPRSDRAGYERWSLALSLGIRYLARYRRDVQMLASVPRPLESERLGNLLRLLQSDMKVLAAGPDLQADGIASAFLQLAYPWLTTRASEDLAEGVEPAEGVLAGQLARNALVNGTFRGAVRVVPRSIVDLVPAPSTEDLLGIEGTECLLDRVSAYGFTPQGIRLRSDVTTSLSKGYRAAGVNRLVGVLLKAARQAGEESVFENSGPNLWQEMESRIGGLLQQFWEAGALGGETPAAAYSVRCDRTTMTQNDIDSGRMIVTVQFVAAYPLEKITVNLVLGEGAAERGAAA